MIQEDKQLLLNDLCARLPYGVKAQVFGWDEEKGEVEVPLKIYSINTDGYVYFGTNDYDVNYLNVDDCLLFLRPMSSMTEEEKKEFDNFCVIDEFVWNGNAEIGYKNQAIIMSHAIDWLNKKMFDYRGLIPKGRAIEVTENNNPYKD